MCVCAREREQERESENERERESIKNSIAGAIEMHYLLLVVLGGGDEQRVARVVQRVHMYSKRLCLPQP